MDGIKVHGAPIGDRGEDLELVGSINAVDVKRRICLGVSLDLGLFEDLCERSSKFRHFREDIVAGTVHNSGNGVDSVGNETLSDRPDDRDPAADAGLKS